MAEAKTKSAKVLRVHVAGRGKTFWRCGIMFHSDTPTFLPRNMLSESDLARILAEPMLRAQWVEAP